MHWGFGEGKKKEEGWQQMLAQGKSFPAGKKKKEVQLLKEKKKKLGNSDFPTQGKGLKADKTQLGFKYSYILFCCSTAVLAAARKFIEYKYKLNNININKLQTYTHICIWCRSWTWTT